MTGMPNDFLLITYIHHLSDKQSLSSCILTFHQGPFALFTNTKGQAQSRE